MSYRMKTNRTTHLTPHEILTGRSMPSPVIRGPQKGPPLEQLETELRRYMGQLTGIHRLIFQQEKGRVPELEKELPRGVEPGDQVYLGMFRRKWNEPRREGPYKVANATPTAIQVEGSATWYHLNHCTKAAQPKARDDREEEEPDADTPGADQLPQDQIQSSQEIQQHDDAENGEPVSDPLRVVPDSAGTSTDPEEG